MSGKRRLLRGDRILLESLEDKYGRESLASAIALLANRTNVEEPSITPQEAVLDYIMYLEGLRIRLREIHWESERNARHTLTDSMISDVESFEDGIAENLMGICGFRIHVGNIVPKITTMVDLCDLLDEFSKLTLQLCASLESNPEYTGIVNELEDMMNKIGRWKYLATMQ